jgi:site-specific DNA-cytosine methylase
MRYWNDPSTRLEVIALFAGVAGLAQISLRSVRCEILALPSIQKVAKQTFQKCYLNLIYECCDILALNERGIQRLATVRGTYCVLGGLPCQDSTLTRSKNSKCDKNSPIGGRYVYLLKKLWSNFLLMENVLQLFYRKQFTNLQYSLGQHCDKDYTILNIVQPAATNDSSPSVFCNSMSIKL